MLTQHGTLVLDNVYWKRHKGDEAFNKLIYIPCISGHSTACNHDEPPYIFHCLLTSLVPCTTTQEAISIWAIPASLHLWVQPTIECWLNTNNNRKKCNLFQFGYCFRSIIFARLNAMPGQHKKYFKNIEQMWTISKVRTIRWITYFCL